MQMRIDAYLGAAWVDITQSVLARNGVSSSVGFPSNKETDRISKNGSLTFTLKNNDESYTPGNMAAHADWKKGTLIRVVFIYQTEKTKFIGRIDSIKLSYNPGDYTAQVNVMDWMYFASQLPLDLPALQTDVLISDVVDDIVSISPVAPFNGSSYIGTGAQIPYAFHDNTVETFAYTEISKAALSEWGLAYVKQDGTFVFEAYNSRASTVKQIRDFSSSEILLEDGSYFLLENGDNFSLDTSSTIDADVDSYSSIDIEYGDRMINRAVGRAYPYKAATEDVLVYTAATNRPVPANSTVNFRLQFTDQADKEPLAVLPPVFKQYTLVHFDLPPDGVTGIIDSGTPVLAGNTTPFSAVSGATYATSVKKFGTASFSFNGSSDYVYSPSYEKYNFRNEDFTVDWWEYRLATTSGRAAISRSTTATYAPYVLGYSNGTRLRCYITSNGSSWDIANDKDMGSISTSVWTHFAITRSGNTYRTFKNGVQQDTWTSSSTIHTTTDDLSIFKYTTNYTNGYIDEFRMIKGYAAWTANFSVPVRQHELSGINWSVFTTPPLSGTELTSSMTASLVAGGTGLDFQIASTSGSVGYLNLDIYATPLIPSPTVSHIAEDATSISDYGYYNASIDMRLRPDTTFPEVISDALVAAEKDPRKVVNKISMVANKNEKNKALFLDCDIGDLINLDDSAVTGIVEQSHIHAISWRAVPDNDNKVIVYFDWLLKKSE